MLFTHSQQCAAPSLEIYQHPFVYRLKGNESSSVSSVCLFVHNANWTRRDHTTATQLEPNDDKDNFFFFELWQLLVKRITKTL